MSTERALRDNIERAAESVGRVWPLHSFVTANPLAGFEDRPFHEAVRQGNRLYDGDGYPGPEVFRRARETGRIDPDRLADRLDEHGYEERPPTPPEQPSVDTDNTTTPLDRVDGLLTKWLAAFLDQGQAHWPMPDRERGFYASFRALAPHDSEIPDRGVLADLPANPAATIDRVLSGHPDERRPDIFEFHLTALPGWVGFIRQRVDSGGEWQSAHPITLRGYLAARLALVDALDAPVEPPDTPESDVGADEGSVPPAEVWLSAWESTYRERLVDALTAGEADEAGDRPDAQLVFCIDTRSELIRRHIEQSGDYETHGYAGFFGVPMRYRGYDADVTVDACPPILDPQHHVTDRPTGDRAEDRAAYDRWSGAAGAGRELVESLRSNAATAFSFVESAGLGYGAGLAARTLLPARVYDLLESADERVPDTHEFCEPSVEDGADGTDLPAGLTHEQRVEYAATAFDLMGWTDFARVVVFAGHASQTVNNPFDASLDCGACAGNPGGPNARVLATICNDDAVRASLHERGVEIPADTVFLAGEHTTTTDEVRLYDGHVPESHAADIEQLRADLATARAGAAAERAGDMGSGDSGVRDTERRAADWAETRPEWGLAGNAAFVVGPRSLTAGLDLDGRVFLHSYDWTTDPDGDALAAIVAGPLVVTQWINSQYYFATVDTAVYGSGSKVTHNPVGNVGVYQGNGGDLMTGLPLQSLLSADDEPYHQPLRLSTIVQAPLDCVTDVLAEHDTVTGLLDNDWLSLTVLDPERDDRPLHYDGNLEWTSLRGERETRDPPATPRNASD